MKDLGPQALSLCNNYSNKAENCGAFMAGLQKVADIAAAEKK